MRLFLLSGLLIIYSCLHAQKLPAIDESEVSRIEKTLAADNMQGRQVFTTGIEKAAAFITQEFRRAGLKPIPGNQDFTQNFVMMEPEYTNAAMTMGGVPMDKKNLAVFSTESSFTITQDNQYRKIHVKTSAEFGEIVVKYLESDEHVLILVDTSLAGNFNWLANIHMPQFNGTGNHIYVLTSEDPVEYRIEVTQKMRKRNLTNLVGMIPGKSKPDEYVIFSAHYDHLGVGKPDASGDSIYNGANDDASGTTAVIALAGYFSKAR
ncbi:MAG TPA: M28 family peptidase, partial [Puia sp.]|nr:M28 family peptidase [Puia sp.]